MKHKASSNAVLLTPKHMLSDSTVVCSDLLQLLWTSTVYLRSFPVLMCVITQGAVGHGYVAQVEQHSSQTDAKRGFGGKFGVQKDRVDKVRKLSSY